MAAYEIAVVTVTAPQEGTQLQTAPLEPQKLQIAAQENSAALAEASQDEKNLKLDPTPVEPQKVSLQNEVVLSPVDDAARTILIPAEKPVEVTSLTVRPDEGTS
ncbi:MAG: hypothetical protein SGJ17_07370 [Hyphomicrobiales bacterium]|nr:hypothetical protein [Hyphomicrobiales bacterium]